MFLLNGERRHCVDVLIEASNTAMVCSKPSKCSSKPLFLPRHLKRLQKGCERLLIPLPELTLLEEEAAQLCVGVERAVLKIIVTRGSGGRGYRQPDSVVPTRLLGLHPFPQYPDCFQRDGIVARFCEQRLAINPVLAGIKHLNRLSGF